MKSPRREQNFEKRIFYEASRLRKTAIKMFEKIYGNAFTVYLTLFKPPDDDIKRKTGSSYGYIEKNFFDS
jgi:hypothetical protein